MITQAVFDLDFTLTDLYGDLFSEIPSILQLLHNKNIKMYIASHNTEAKKELTDLKFDRYFVDYSLGFPNDCPDKTENLKILKLNKKTCVFFDDDIQIVTACRKQGWNAVKVSTTGVTMNDVLEILNDN